MKKTKIEWCDSTWNPVTGCLHDCNYCYARRIADRFSYTKDWRAFPVNLELDEPIRDAVTGKATAYPHGFAPTLHRYRLDEPARWTKSRNIFVCSMADLFGEWVPDSWIEEVFTACDAAPQHRYMFLTKNPKRLCALANEKKLPIRENWWFGSSVDTMKRSRYPGRIRDNTFISVEPLLEEMDVGLGSFGGADWVIIGAETGNRKDKVVPEKAWVDKICEAADITHMAVFMKDSLLPIMGEENMRREFPWDKK